MDSLIIAGARVGSLADLVRQRAERQPGEIVYSFLADGQVETGSLTYGELDRWARAVGAVVQELVGPGERVVLLFPEGLEFLAAFFGCVISGRVAVPTYPPRPTRPQRDVTRLRAIAADSRPSLFLTTAALASRLAPLLASDPILRTARLLALDDVDLRHADAWREPRMGPDSLAFLQYTSGSTAAPKGVMVSHGNVLANLEMIRQGFGHQPSLSNVGWLPLFHDMGLVGNVLQPLYAGMSIVLMPPAVFLHWPVRWLQAISRYRAHTSGGPNFGFEWCVRKIKPEQCAGLDLSSWEVAFCGAEPIRAGTLAAFVEKFGPYGFRASALYPCYGLAEVTLFGSGARKGAGATLLEVDGPALEQGRVALAEDARRSRRLVSSGSAWLERRIAIVEPEAGTACPPQRVGEIWLGGPDVARGYWGQPEETERSFGARLAAPGDGAAAGDGPFLRTGDLGFVRAGELYVTGRLKDLLILDGRNYYPQDLELTAERSHVALRPGGSAAFSVEVGGEERPVLVAELEREYSVPGPDGRVGLEGIARVIRQATAEQHGQQWHAVVLVRVGAVPKTTSGKVRRAATRAAYLADTLEGVLLHHPWSPPARRAS